MAGHRTSLCEIFPPECFRVRIVTVIYVGLPSCADVFPRRTAFFLRHRGTLSRATHDIGRLSNSHIFPSIILFFVGDGLF